MIYVDTVVRKRQCKQCGGELKKGEVVIVNTMNIYHKSYHIDCFEKMVKLVVEMAREEVIKNARKENRSSIHGARG